MISARKKTNAQSGGSLKNWADVVLLRSLVGYGKAKAPLVLAPDALLQPTTTYTHAVSWATTTGATSAVLLLYDFSHASVECNEDARSGPSSSLGRESIDSMFRIGSAHDVQLTKVSTLVASGYCTSKYCICVVLYCIVLNRMIPLLYYTLAGPHELKELATFHDK